jgi:RNA polymerase sigma-70 factor (ECF subfamily)
MGMSGETAARCDESRLIRAGQRGDRQAVEKLLCIYRRQLFRRALRVLGNGADAEDVLQEAMLSAFRALPRFEGRSRFSTWLTRIVINAALMRKRALKVQVAVSLEETKDSIAAPLLESFPRRILNPEEKFARTELREQLVSKIGELSPSLRAAFVLCQVEGYSTKETAARLGLTSSTAKVSVWRARRRLAAALSRRHSRSRVISPTNVCIYYSRIQGD